MSRRSDREEDAESPVSGGGDGESPGELYDGLRLLAKPRRGKAFGSQEADVGRHPARDPRWRAGSVGLSMPSPPVEAGVDRRAGQGREPAGEVAPRRPAAGGAGAEHAQSTCAERPRFFGVWRGADEPQLPGPSERPGLEGRAPSERRRVTRQAPALTGQTSSGTSQSAVLCIGTTPQKTRERLGGRALCRQRGAKSG